MKYWAVYPISAGLQIARIEKATNPSEAIRRAFGIRPDKGRWLAKELGFDRRNHSVGSQTPRGAQ